LKLHSVNIQSCRSIILLQLTWFWRAKPARGVIRLWAFGDANLKRRGMKLRSNVIEFLRRLPSLFAAISLGLLGSACTGPVGVDPSASADEKVLQQGAIASLAAIAPIRQENYVRLGVYDPIGAFANADHISLQHLFLSWIEFDAEAFFREYRQSRAQGRDLLVSVEPFTRRGSGSVANRSIFAEILRGDYDRETQDVCAAIGATQARVLVRFGHEMDDRSGRYPWAQPDATGYVQAYRHFVEQCRKFAPLAKFVWSPMGESTLSEYYPGAAYVDYVGIPVWALQSWDLQHFRRARSFAEIVEEKYRRVAIYGKPIIVAEFGVSGDHQYTTSILAGVRGSIHRFPGLKSVVYFNMKEPYYWPGGFGSPDWRISPERFQ
jgi:endoglucanase